MGIAYIVNAPFIFSFLWNIISPFIDPVTKAKAKFVSYTAADEASPLLEGIDSDHLEREYGGTMNFDYNFDACFSTS